MISSAPALNLNGDSQKENDQMMHEFNRLTETLVPLRFEIVSIYQTSFSEDLTRLLRVCRFVY